MRRTVRSLILVGIVAAMLTPLSASASHDPNAPDPNMCRGTIGGQYVSNANHVQIPVVTSVAPVNIPPTGTNGPFYLDLRDVASQYWGFSIWLYQETNGTNGLQRGGAAIFPAIPGATNNVDPCVEGTRWDTGIF